MEIDVNGVKITLTKEQLKEIDKQVNKKKSVIERIQSIEDIYSELNICRDLPYKGCNLTKKQKAINAQYDIQNIVEVYNEGVILDWKKSNQYKYLPYRYWDVSSGSWLVYCYSWGSSYFGAGCYFKSNELGLDAVKKFRNIYDDFWI